MKNNLKIVVLKGLEIVPYISDLARLRIDIFKEYPYLYVGDLDYEADYLATYANCLESIVVFIFDRGRVVGASTAIPLIYQTTEFQAPFIDHNIKIEEVFYLGESVLQPEYRGCNIYRHFFNEREAAAKKYGCTIKAFSSVERSSDDPRKPKNYFPLDNVWNHFGYKKNPNLKAYFKWAEIGEEAESLKPLIFWLKN